MEDEARLMEAKLQLLRKTMDETAPPPAAAPGGGRWKSGSAQKPLTRGYVKDVLDTTSAKRKTSQRAPSTGRKSPGLNGTGTAGRPGSNSASRTASPARSPTGLSQMLGSRQVDAAPAAALVGAPAAPASRAAANIQAAVQQTSDDMKDVEAFLAGLQLDRYVALFAEHGFDCMEVVQEMEDSHMQELGMATGHIIKLKKKLAEINPPKAAPAPAAPVRTMTEAAASTRRSVTFGATEVKSQAAASPAPERLIEGGFDEDESAASFQEALKAWREGREVSDAPRKSPTVASYNAAANKAATGSFWSTVGGGEMNLERASTPIKAPTEPSTQETETVCDPAPGDDKLCCYNCYKQFFARFAQERTSPLDSSLRRFCSTQCGDSWHAAMAQKAEEQRKRMEKIAAMQEAQRAYEEERRLGATVPAATAAY